MVMRSAFVIAGSMLLVVCPEPTKDSGSPPQPEDTGCPGDQLLTTWYLAADGDRYGDPDQPMDACEMPDGYVDDGTDCDDVDATVNPGAVEFCDGQDNDCDGELDEADAYGATAWYADDDGDGFGDPGSEQMSCDQPLGYIEDATDCDDAQAAINPAADELCDGLDNDCDGEEDEASALDASEWYADVDGDGYGDPLAIETACDQPTGSVADSTDCDDADFAVNPGAMETCNGVDDDCDGSTDEEDAIDALTWSIDHDGDGFGSSDYTTMACEQPSGFVLDDSDCDDLEPAANPGV